MSKETALGLPPSSKIDPMHMYVFKKGIITSHMEHQQNETRVCYSNGGTFYFFTHTF
jgi:hypothetical protein